MDQYALAVHPSDENFNERAYLAANPDVAAAVRDKRFPSGWQHFVEYGRDEKRLQHFCHDTRLIANAKRRKLERIRPLLRDDMPCAHGEWFLDFLTADLRAQFNIVDTEAVSSNPYNDRVMRVVTEHANGLVLDCGAGWRPVYFSHVVNFEIAPYNTTDVRGVGEALPFKDDSFDAVISMAVLEHVKDPFRCAAEIARVLKPGGELVCAVPFLQPLHGYPHHYYNMTHQGLRNLFEGLLEIENVDVHPGMRPIASLTWILRSWSEGLCGPARQEFLDLRVADLLGGSKEYCDRPFVTELPEQKNLELASACFLKARKPA